MEGDDAMTLRSSILAIVLLAFPMSVSAQNDAAAPGPIGRMMHGLNPMNWKMPQMKMPKLPTMKNLLPTKQEKKRVIEKKNNFVDEVSQTAKKSWQRTKKTLNPMNYIPAGFKQNRTVEPAPKTEGGGFFSGLFSPTTPKKSETPNDFLRQDPVR